VQLARLVHARLHANRAGFAIAASVSALYETALYETM